MRVCVGLGEQFGGGCICLEARELMTRASSKICFNILVCLIAFWILLTYMLLLKFYVPTPELQMITCFFK